MGTGWGPEVGASLPLPAAPQPRRCLLPLLLLLPLACLSPRSSPCGFPYQHPHSCQPLRVSLVNCGGSRQPSLRPARE